jgi:hypothetical protein
MLTAIGWAVVGPSQIASYRQAAAAADALARASYSPYALFDAAGLSATGAKVCAAAAGVALLAACFAARRIDLRAFNFALAAALVISPVVWIHYLVLLYVPIALARPRLSALWFLPAIYVFVGLRAHADGSLTRISVNLAVTAVAFVLADSAFARRRPLWSRAPLVRSRSLAVE